MIIPEIKLQGLDKNLHGKQTITIPASASSEEELEYIKQACQKITKQVEPFHCVKYDGKGFATKVIKEQTGMKKLLEFGYEVFSNQNNE